MQWNWQKPDWPNFQWDHSQLAAPEEKFLLGSGVIVGAIKHLGPYQHSELLVEMMIGEALTTSEIEGEILNRASVQSSIQRALGLGTAARRATPAEEGIAEMMVNLYRSFSKPLARETLFSWHRMVTSGRRDLRNMGNRFILSKTEMGA